MLPPLNLRFSPEVYENTIWTSMPITNLYAISGYKLATMIGTSPFPAVTKVDQIGNDSHIYTQEGLLVTLKKESYDKLEAYMSNNPSFGQMANLLEDLIRTTKAIEALSVSCNELAANERTLRLQVQSIETTLRVKVVAQAAEEKKVLGLQHILQTLKEENAALKQKQQDQASAIAERKVRHDREANQLLAKGNDHIAKILALWQGLTSADSSALPSRIGSRRNSHESAKE